MGFPLNIIIFGAIVLLLILILGADMKNNNNNKCEKPDNCQYPHCRCFPHNIK